jgi:hypothetical protein
MVAAGISQDANRPDKPSPPNDSPASWAVVCVAVWTMGVVAALPTLYVNPMVDMEGFGNRAFVEQMSFSHYTMRGTIAESLPFNAYQASLYPQPPGYFAVLKIFADWAGPANKENESKRTSACQSAEFFLHATALLVYIVAMSRWCQSQHVGVIPSGMAMFTIAVCPILLANTVWLRADGIAALLGAASLLLLTCDEESHWSSGIGAGIVGGLALLMHASTLWIIPLAVVLVGLARQQLGHKKLPSFLFGPLIVFLVIALGMSSAPYIRLIATEGPAAVFRMYQSPLDSVPNDDSRLIGVFYLVFRRPVVELILEWVAIAPVLVIVLGLVSKVRGMLAGDESEHRIGDRWIVATLLLIFVDFSLRWTWGGAYQLRFCSLWAVMLAPAMVACYQRCSSPWRSWAARLAMVTLFFQVAGCIPAATSLGEPSYVTPVPAYMVRPWLDRYFPVSKLKAEQAG